MGGFFVTAKKAPILRTIAYVTTLSLGAWTLQVRAVDRAGNTASAPTSASFRLTH